MGRGSGGVRLCHINLAKGYRGGERQTELLIRELAQRGLHQGLIVRRGSPMESKLAGVGNLEIASIAKSYVLDAGIARAFDLIHAHDGKGAKLAWMMRLLRGKPYLITRRVDKPPGMVNRWAYQQAAAVVAVSAAIAELLQTRFSLRESAAVVYDAHADLHSDGDTIARLRNRFAGRFLIGHVGALVNRHKGQLHLIRAARCIADSHPDIQFVLLGAGEDEALLRQEAAGLNNVHFEGFVDNVGDYLAAFDLFAFPSLFEGLGSTILDAFYFGLPVVASRVGGIPEIVIDGENGLLVPPGDEAALMAALLRLYNDDALRMAFSVKARHHAQRHAPARMADEYIRIYQRLLSF